MSFQVADKLLTLTKALPNGAASVVSDPFDLGHDPTKLGRHLANCEIEISAPLLVVGDLADAATMKYSIETDDAVGFGSAKIVALEVLVQTGAGGVGAAAKTVRFRLPSDVERFVRVRATNSGAGDASDKSMTVKLLF